MIFQFQYLDHYPLYLYHHHLNQSHFPVFDLKEMIPGNPDLEIMKDKIVKLNSELAKLQVKKMAKKYKDLLDYYLTEIAKNGELREILKEDDKTDDNDPF